MTDDGDERRERLRTRLAVASDEAEDERSAGTVIVLGDQDRRPVEAARAGEVASQQAQQAAQQRDGEA